MDQVSELLKTLVPKKGKSTAEVARKLEISSQLLGQYMAGRQNPKAIFYKKWKKVFGEDLLAMTETNVSHGKEDVVVITESLPTIIGSMQEELIRLKAITTVLLVTVEQSVSTQTGKSIASVSVELRKAIDDEANRLFDQLGKKA